LARAKFFAPDRLVDLTPMDRDLIGSINSEANFVATDSDHRDDNVVSDDDLFVFLSRQN
jgi:hypothetical protein